MAEISKNAFLDDDLITKANFGENCYTINDNAFEDCNYLIEINDENHIKNIGNYAFKNATSLSEATFNNLENMGSGAFEGCKNLTKIQIPMCTNIYDNTFNGCRELKDFDFENINAIGRCAFNDCQKLTSIHLTKCAYIGSEAFKNCENIEHVYINITDNRKICELGDQNAFLKDDGSIINNKIKFYVNKKAIEQYRKKWYTYERYIIPAAIDSNQIRYETTDDEAISLKEGIDAKNEYFKEYGYGIITFKDDVTSLNQIFTDNSRLKSIELPPSCTTIGESAFSGCEKLQTIKMPNVIEIKYKAFENCKNLTSFEIPKSVATLGEGIFAGCDSISEFKGNFSTKDGRAIVYKNILISVVSTDTSKIHNISDFGENIYALGAYCFEGCVNMRRIDIPYNIVKINDGAFANCENLYEIHLNRNYKDNENLILGADVFKNIDKDYKIFVQETELIKWVDKLNPYKDNLYPKPQQNEIIYYIDYKINNNIIRDSDTIDISNNNNYINGKYFKINISNNIVPKIFAERNNITKVITNEETIIISDGAFLKCKNLEYVYLSEKIELLDSQCFYECEKLKRIHIPSKATFGSEIFVGCKKLNEFGTYYKGYVTDDGRCYMSKNDNGYTTLMFFAGGAKNEGEDPITEYTIPDDIKIIGKYAFATCVLTTINGCNNVNVISNYAFKGCVKLVNFTLPKNLTSIGAGAFEGCKNYNPTIPNSVSSLGVNCFKKTGITELWLFKTNNLTKIPNGAFENCESLIYVDMFNSNITEIGSKAFSGCVNLEVEEGKERYFLPDGVTNINDSAFENCKGITYAYLPKNLQYLGNNSFLTNADDMKIFVQNKLIIPVFRQNGRVNPKSNPFGDLSNGKFITIYVPSSIYDNYIYNSEDWRKYRSIIESY